MIIKTPSRLHMTLIDMNGSYGRVDGGIGLTIKHPNFVLFGEHSERGITIDFDDKITDEEIRQEAEKKIRTSAEKIIKYYDIDEGFYFNVKKAYIPHSGLGSGSQISLATSKLITEHIGQEATGSQLGNIIGRGGTSGIGIFSFDYGGFIVDGGHNLAEKGTILPSSKSPAKPPQLIARYDFPEEWEILIVILKSNDFVTGNKEIDLFTDNCPVPKDEVEQLSHIILMNLIPFLLEKNLPEFSNSINQIQNKGFKKVEIRLQSADIASLRNKLEEFGAYGSGMSSFGPTVYSIFDKNNKDIVEKVKEYVGDKGIVYTTKAQNYGHEIIK